MKKANLLKFVTLTTFLFGAGSSTPLWAKSTSDAIKDYVEEASQSLKKYVDKLGDKFEDIEREIRRHQWRGSIHDEMTSANATLRDLCFKGDGDRYYPRVTIVEPGQKVEGTVQCSIDPNKSSSLSFYRVVLGLSRPTDLRGTGPKLTIGNEFGLTARKTLESFSFTAPPERGIYEVRFRVVDSYFTTNAFEAWRDEHGNEPDASTTLGIVIVK